MHSKKLGSHFVVFRVVYTLITTKGGQNPHTEYTTEKLTRPAMGNKAICSFKNRAATPCNRKPSTFLAAFDVPPTFLKFRACSHPLAPCKASQRSFFWTLLTLMFNCCLLDTDHCRSPPKQARLCKGEQGRRSWAWWPLVRSTYMKNLCWSSSTSSPSRIIHDLMKRCWGHVSQLFFKQPLHLLIRILLQETGSTRQGRFSSLNWCQRS